MGLFFLILLAALAIGTVVFLYTSPQFGGATTKDEQKRFALTDHYKEGSFVNLGGVVMDMNLSTMLKATKAYFQPQPNTTPDNAIPVKTLDANEVAGYTGPTRMVWFGHSAFLLQMQGKNILIDPMLSQVPAPHPMLGAKRFSEILPITAADLPAIDAVLFSHDHYDHLDYESVLALKDKVKRFYVPLGLSAHLVAWGVAKEQITELDWWDVVSLDDISFTCTPAQHFSGRGLSDKGKTLWSGWAIATEKENIFFSGDSGYGSHFKAIGERLGPFDFAMLECGQYNELWKEIHMMPEQTAQAGVDVKAKQIMPIHWGAFKLAMHPWTEPAERVIKKANALGIPIRMPQIGAPIYFQEPVTTPQNWWDTIKE